VAGQGARFRCFAAQLTVIALTSTLAVGTAGAQEMGELTALINDLRSASQSCEGKQMPPAGPLAPDPALARVQIEQGDQLQHALKRAGYQAAQAQSLTVMGARNARVVLAFIRQRYCRTLLDPRYAQIGVSRDGNNWRIVLARPLLSPDLGDWREAGREVLKLTNAARAEPRTCGNERFPAASPLEWNDRLAAAARAHSSDMATRNYFRHAGQGGSQVSDRASRAGYAWRRVGENIATGQGSAKQVVSAWLASPEHCANIMNRGLAEMGAAYAVNPDSDTGIYWTQVFGTPR
jgi:Cysteine-rich secretory protein family